MSKSEIKQVITNCFVSYFEDNLYEPDLDNSDSFVTIAEKRYIDDDKDDLGYSMGEYDVMQMIDMIHDHFLKHDRSVLNEDIFFTGTIREIIARATKDLEKAGVKINENYEEKSRWSPRTRLLTGQLAQDVIEGKMPGYYMKHLDMKHGMLKYDTKLRIVDRETGEEYAYSSVDELIDAGWVVD